MLFKKLVRFYFILKFSAVLAVATSSRNMAPHFWTVATPNWPECHFCFEISESIENFEACVQQLKSYML